MNDTIFTLNIQSLRIIGLRFIKYHFTLSTLFCVIECSCNFVKYYKWLKKKNCVSHAWSFCMNNKLQKKKKTYGGKSCQLWLSLYL